MATTARICPGIQDRRPLARVGEHEVIPEEEAVETGLFRGHPEADHTGRVIGEGRDGQRPAQRVHGPPLEIRETGDVPSDPASIRFSWYKHQLNQ